MRDYLSFKAVRLTGRYDPGLNNISSMFPKLEVKTWMKMGKIFS
jgi:hypothetical protein